MAGGAKFAEFAQKAAGFRKTFSVSEDLQIRKFYGKHMRDGMLKMEENLSSVRCVIEIHDARIPLSGRNKLFFEKIYAKKPHVLVLNKADLVDRSKLPLYAKVIKSQGVNNVVWTCSKDLQSVDNFKQIMNIVKKDCKLDSENHLMLVGLPNCGKSSLINGLRYFGTKTKTGAEVGPTPGVTKHVSRLQINKTPPIYLFDTPGITPLGKVSLEVTMKMGLCHLTVEENIGRHVLADYLLYWLNKNSAFEYVDVLGLKEPIDDSFELLRHLAVRENFLTSQKKLEPIGDTSAHMFDIDRAATLFLNYFRKLQFGKIILDTEQLTQAQNTNSEGY